MTAAVERSPLGDERQRPVPCRTRGCRRLTFNHTAVCGRCQTNDHDNPEAYEPADPDEEGPFG